MSSSIDKPYEKYIYLKGDKIYDIHKNKCGTIKHLRDDSHEKSMREYNQTHYYYFIDYEDGTFDSYVNVNDFMPYMEQNYVGKQINNDNIGLTNFNYKNFKHGQRFYSKKNNKFGTIKYLRDDYREKQMRQTDLTHYYYHVDFDDGSFETYIHGMYLQPI